MNKKVESLLFIVVALAIVLSLRFALAGVDRTAREYEYASALNLEKQATQVADQTEEDARQDENLDDTDPDEPEEEQTGDETHYDTRQNQDPNDASDRSDSQSVDNGSGAGNGNGRGDGNGGNGGNTGGDTAATPAPTPAPTPTPYTEPQPDETNKPDETKKPQERLKSIKARWSEPVAIYYEDNIEEYKKKIEVTAVYDSGREEILHNGEYSISGFSSVNKGCGQHTMKLSYQGESCHLGYSVENWTKSIFCKWDFDDSQRSDNNLRLYKGEMIWDEVLSVCAKVADQTDKNGDGEGNIDLYYGEYNVTGLDPNKTGEIQHFTVTYQGITAGGKSKTFTATGECRFNDRIMTTHTIYCNDAEHQDIVSQETDTETIKVNGKKTKQIKAAETKSVEKNGKIYTLADQSLTVEGKDRKLPYTLVYDRREFNLEFYQYYVYDKSKNIASIQYEWKGNGTEDGELSAGKSFASQIRIFAVMEDGEKKELKYSSCQISGLDETLTGKRQKFKITYKDWSVSGSCILN